MNDSAGTRRHPRIGWWVIWAVFISSATAIGVQHYRATVLQEEVEWLRGQVQERTRLQRLNRQLAQTQTADAELQRLRADHAAVQRLRAEVADLQTRAERMEHAAAADEAHAQVRSAGAAERK